ncbi:MAG: hypothetical protein AB7R87_22605 [Parvibaculaceae bacterium]
MSQLVAELRKAAASARAFADHVGSPELKHSFENMARRWEAEAEARESEDAAGGHPPSFIGPASMRKH